MFHDFKLTLYFTRKKHGHSSMKGRFPWFEERIPGSKHCKLETFYNFTYSYWFVVFRVLFNHGSQLFTCDIIEFSFIFCNNTTLCYFVQPLFVFIYLFYEHDVLKRCNKISTTMFKRILQKVINITDIF